MEKVAQKRQLAAIMFARRSSDISRSEGGPVQRSLGEAGFTILLSWNK